MYLEVITPDKKVFEGEVESATFPGTDGFFQILNSHAPLISTLGKGPITYTVKKEGEDSVNVKGGVVEVLNNKVVALVESLTEDED
jgi:F-type H+-transporting ATPase subunit epsilon